MFHIKSKKAKLPKNGLLNEFIIPVNPPCTTTKKTHSAQQISTKIGNIEYSKNHKALREPENNKT